MKTANMRGPGGKIRASGGNKIQLLENIGRLKNDAEKSLMDAECKKFIIKSVGLFEVLAAVDKKNTGNYYKNRTFESLMIENTSLYAEVLPGNYDKSFVNPDYCARLFGAAAGPALAGVYYEFRTLIKSAYLHKTEKIAEYFDALVKLYRYFKSIKTAADIKIEPIVEIDRSLIVNNIDCKKEDDLNERFSPDFNFYKEIINSADKEDLRYLFRYGCYIGYNEIKTADFINKLDESEILRLAKHINGAFIEGFKTENKARGGRNLVKIVCGAGYERVVKTMMAEFARIGFETIIGGMVSSNPNRQADYDHRYDEKPFLSAEYNKIIINSYERAFDKLSDKINRYCGHIRIGRFGELPFSPVESAFSRTLDKDEEDLYNKLVHDTSAQFSARVPDKNTSFSLISFPTPEIGPDFEEIFAEILRINTLDTNKYILIQQKIIDVLDGADFIHIKGAAGNKTDIRVKMHKLSDPAAQTNFYNCGADVNIPAGEVFTTPVLKGTNGVLHAASTYLDGFNYKELVIEFKDGLVADYSCKNFKSAAENKKYIEQNLFKLKKNLPMGEFAIGSNTIAYAAAKKFDILEKLPILITEKMGPHFAIGDSCYLYVEDIPIYNQINKKEITARDNERTILRKTDLEKAYTNVHVDITLPYESIGFIAAVAKGGRKSVKIIENGRFALKGCESLNAPLDGVR
jgi:hypothetical protein